MDFKKFWNNSNIAFILKNIIVAGILLLVIVWITLWAIGRYTQHGETELVPDLRGLYVEEAIVLLKKQDLYANVVDSMYVANKALGSIVEQIPLPNSTVKRGRPIYLIINSRQIRQIPLPDVNDVSFRQAEATLKSIGLKIGSVQYAPSEYKNLVLSVSYNGQTIAPGTRLPEGSSLTLIVGHGLSDGEEAAIPSLKGLSLENARQTAMSASFVIGAVEYDVTPSDNESEYVIYRQSPSTGSYTSPGSRIDIWLSKDKTLLDKEFDDPKNGHEDEEFF